MVYGMSEIVFAQKEIVQVYTYAVFEQGNLEGLLYTIVTKNFPVFFGMLTQLRNDVYDVELSQTSN